jgi:hypothetical protein
MKRAIRSNRWQTLPLCLFQRSVSLCSSVCLCALSLSVCLTFLSHCASHCPFLLSLCVSLFLSSLLCISLSLSFSLCVRLSLYLSFSWCWQATVEEVECGGWSPVYISAGALGSQSTDPLTHLVGAVPPEDEDIVVDEEEDSTELSGACSPHSKRVLHASAYMHLTLTEDVGRG